MGKKNDAETCRNFCEEFWVRCSSTHLLNSDYDLTRPQSFSTCHVRLQEKVSSSAKPHVLVTTSDGGLVLDVPARSTVLYRSLARFDGRELSNLYWHEVGNLFMGNKTHCHIGFTAAPEHDAYRDIDRIFLDVETTGLDSRRDEILQLSIIDGGGNVLLDRKYRPVHVASWPDAQKIHHIGPADVSRCKPIIEDLAGIQSILNRACRVYAFNSPFDFGFLGVLGLHIDAERGYDTMRLYAMKYRGSEFIKLTEAAAEVGYEYHPHDALADCLATMHVQDHIDSDAASPSMPPVASECSRSASILAVQAQSAFDRKDYPKATRLWNEAGGRYRDLADIAHRCKDGVRAFDEIEFTTKAAHVYLERLHERYDMAGQSDSQVYDALASEYLHCLVALNREMTKTADEYYDQGEIDSDMYLALAMTIWFATKHVGDLAAGLPWNEKLSLPKTIDQANQYLDTAKTMLSALTRSKTSGAFKPTQGQSDWISESLGLPEYQQSRIKPITEGLPASNNSANTDTAENTVSLSSTIPQNTSGKKIDKRDGLAGKLFKKWRS